MCKHLKVRYILFWVSLKANPEIRICVQTDYLETVETMAGEWESDTGREKQQ